MCSTVSDNISIIWAVLSIQLCYRLLLGGAVSPSEPLVLVSMLGLYLRLGIID